jgi:hypothetical protein
VLRHGAPGALVAPIGASAVLDELEDRPDVAVEDLDAIVRAVMVRARPGSVSGRERLRAGARLAMKRGDEEAAPIPDRHHARWLCEDHRAHHGQFHPLLAHCRDSGKRQDRGVLGPHAFSGRGAQEAGPGGGSGADAGWRSYQFEIAELVETPA